MNRSVLVDDALRSAVGLDPGGVDREATGSAGLLASRFAVLELAAVAVGAVEDAADRLRIALGFEPLHASLDLERIAAAYQSDRLLRIDGAAVDAFAPLSGFFAAADGWVRTHANYPHHRRRLTAMLGIDDQATRPELASAIASHSALDLESEAAGVGALLVAVRTAVEWSSTPQASVDDGPLVRRHGGSAGSRIASSLRPTRRHPLRGLRVLDLTRVIAGPVSTRTLALLGADVLRVDPPQIPEIPWQYTDSGQGKRTAALDASTPRGLATLQSLSDEADILVTGYRPHALDGLGLRRRDSLVTGSVDAWGATGPWGDRRGFDSLVQAATGIAVVEGEDGAPGALPAQALDHSAGYLLAAAIVDDVVRVVDGGEAGRSSVSLARVGAALQRLPRAEDRHPSALPGARCLVTHGAVTTARPALSAFDDHAFPAAVLRSTAPQWIARS
ncbi:CoA transferase [Plantibacter sp. Leaf314]|uniref:CoA transferase n=1 Tax=Plantibacter sp. Leaf314 TaxID=1736333 RepID=UPI0009E6AF87|nr:CoA transferase [Plantibacter sp. Leaf314]